MTFTFATEQAAFIRNAMKDVVIGETFGNENGNGNKLFAIVKQWEELRK